MSEITSSNINSSTTKLVLSNSALCSILVSKWKTVPTFLFIGMALNMPRHFRILGKFQSLPNFYRQYSSLSISYFLWMCGQLILIEIRALGKDVASRLFIIVIIIITWKLCVFPCWYKSYKVSKTTITTTTTNLRKQK